MKIPHQLVKRVPESIFGRLRLLLAAVFAIGSLFALSAAWFFASAAATDAYDRLLISAATQIAEAVGVEQGQFFVLPPDSAFETLAQSKGDRFFFAVRAPDGELLTGESTLRALTAGPPGERPTLEFRHFSNARMRTVEVQRLIASPTASGWCTVVVAQTLEARAQLVFRLMTKIGATILAVAALGFLASLEAVKRTLLPFDRISRALAERKAQDLHPLEVKSPRETQALVEAINSALRRLSVRLNALQGFARLAAHQIRTPLAALSAQFSLLLTDAVAESRTQRVARIQAQIARLSRLTNQLLGQAMISYRSERVPHREVELVELVRNVMKDAVPESLERDLAVEVLVDTPSISIEGDSISLREAVANLINNAVTHGAHSMLRIVFEIDQTHVSVCVADDGPGIPREEWEMALQPFRLERDEGIGAGLGLSIAADVAKAHNGELLIGERADGLFEIRLRVAISSRAIP